MSSSAATTSPPPLAVVVCGAYESTGKAVIEGLKPEYEGQFIQLFHFISVHSAFQERYIWAWGMSAWICVL